jgi:hypothetical protein
MEVHALGVDYSLLIKTNGIPEPFKMTSKQNG